MSMFPNRLTWALTACVLAALAVPVALVAGGGKVDSGKERAKPVEAVPNDPEPLGQVRVRELTVKDAPRELRGGNKIRELMKAHNVTELGGREVSAEWNAERERLAGQVKFGREFVVLVGYETGGPPFGELKYRINQQKREVEFYCQEPNNETDRGEKLKVGLGFYVVPSGTKVKWGGVKE